MANELFRDFDAALRQANGNRPSFQLAGQNFNCRKAIKLGIIALYSKVDENNEEEIFKYLRKFFWTAIVKEDRQRFLDLFDAQMNATLDLEEDDGDDEDEVVTLQQVMGVMTWLIGHYTGNPTERPSPLSDGQPETGPSSKVVSLSRGTVKAS